MGGNYAISSLGGYDPYMMYALNSPNYYALLQAQAGNETQGAGQAKTASEPAFKGSDEELANLPKADYSESSNTGTILGVGATAAITIAGGLAYAAKRGNGKGIKAGLKAIWNGITGKADDAAAEGVSKKLNEIKVTLGADGKPRYQIPGKTTKVTDQNEIQRLLDENKELRSLSGLGKNIDKKIESATFKLEDGGVINTITFDGDKIVRITNNNGADITAQFVKDGKLLSSFNNVADREFATKIEQAITKVKNVDKEVLGKQYDLSDITYTTRIGDNQAKVFRAKINANTQNGGSKPEIKELTTLKELDADSKEVLAYIRTQREAGNDISAIIGKDFVEKGKLPNGFKIGTFNMQDGNNLIRVVDGKADGITIGGVFYDGKSDTFKAYMEKHEKAINDMIKDALKDNKIPEGATILPI